MARVFVLTNTETGKVLAVYSDEALADKLLEHVASKLNCSVTLTSTRLDPDLAIIGNDEVNK